MRYAASHHTITNYQLASPLKLSKPTNKAGRVTAKIEGILYLQGTQVVEKGFTQTWVAPPRLQFYLAQLDLAQLDLH